MARMQVRARAVDMLGRQQVAGIPTAISELFKNAHDAYAHNVQVDYYRRARLFVLRDDGVGMSRQDFERRWLTVGTESKVQEGGLGTPIDLDQPLRPIMGEKGIGRLAISVIGPQVLALTRSKSEKGNITVAFINWGLFSLPGIDLSDIEIPVREIEPNSLPDGDMVREMVDEVRANLKRLEKQVPAAAAAAIFEQLDAFNVDPEKLGKTLPKGPELHKEGHGVHFYILPADETLADDIDGSSEDKVTPLQRFLLGFSNTMTPGHKRPPITASFRDHLPTGLMEERIDGDNFFTPYEFVSADHHISGSFDEYGQFSGHVQVYGGPKKPYTIYWPDGEGRPTQCGPFSINFAYLQGDLKDSRVPSDQHASIRAKLDKIGGLYIYRDGLRILPYGDSDYDFINIEKRRTLSAKWYFFSYRRIFGVIELTRKQNGKLLEKAGREGFQENKAYRQFRGILEHFFIQTAATYFRLEGSDSEEWLNARDRRNKEFALLERRKKLISVKRRDFVSSLELFFNDINSRIPEAKVEEILGSARIKLTSGAEDFLTASDLMVLESDARKLLRDVDGKYRLSRPRGVGLTKTTARYWARYEIERQRLRLEVFEPAQTQLEEMVRATQQRLGLELDGRKRVLERLRETSERERRRTKSLYSDTRKQMEALGNRVAEITRTGITAVEATIRDTFISLERLELNELPDAELAKLQKELENKVMVVAEEQSGLLERLREQLKTAATPEGLEQDDIVAALEGELEVRREQDLESLQLAQMGMAVGIVHHEFRSVIIAIRNNIRRLKSWADKNPNLNKLYDEIRESYAHLDSYLSLFTPLNQRLRRQKMWVKGEDIQAYVEQLLGDRMQRHNIRVIATESFRLVQLEEYASTLYPCFINLVDNAIFWLNNGKDILLLGRDQQREGREKWIKFDFFDGAFVVSDNGPGVLTQDEEIVFEAGFSRKPQGSGLGLYISRNILERSGYRLELMPYSPGKGATFRITVPLEAIRNDDEREQS